MGSIIAIGAIILMIWPVYKIISALLKVGFALFSGALNLAGKLIIIGLVIAGFIVAFPWSIIVGVVIFVVYKAIRS